MWGGEWVTGNRQQVAVVIPAGEIARVRFWRAGTQNLSSNEVWVPALRADASRHRSGRDDKIVSAAWLAHRRFTLSKNKGRGDGASICFLFSSDAATAAPRRANLTFTDTSVKPRCRSWTEARSSGLRAVDPTMLRRISMSRTEVEPTQPLTDLSWPAVLQAAHLQF